MPIVLVASATPPNPNQPVAKTPSLFAFTNGIEGPVRLDLNQSADIYVAHDSLDFGAPSLEGDPGATGAQYGTRDITLEVIVKRTAAGALTFLSTLSKELQREGNWLMVELEPTRNDPVWFETFRTAPGSLSLAEVRTTDNDVAVGWWSVTVALTASSTARGAKQTIPTFTLGNDPAAGGTVKVLPTIVGDWPTPLSIGIRPSAALTNYRPLMSVVRYDGAARAAVVWQTSAFAATNDTTHASGSATFSAGTQSNVTFATAAGMTTRLSGTAPVTPEPGRYRVLVRMARADSSSTYAVQLLQSYGSGLVGNGVAARFDRGTTSGNNFATLLDLGEFSFPLGGDGWRPGQTASPSAPVVALQVQRTGGTGTAMLDYLVLVPVDTVSSSGATTLGASFRDVVLPATTTAVFDGEAERFWALDTTTGTVPQVLAPEPSGQYLIADPAAANVLYLFQQVNAITPAAGGADNPDTIAASAQVSISYHPQYLFMVAAPSS